MRNPLTTTNFIPLPGVCQDAKAEQANASLLTQELKGLFDAIEDKELLVTLAKPLGAGRPRDYAVEALWHSFLAQYYLNLPTINSLVRRLQDDPYLVQVCGFDMDRPLPVRRTFDHFFENLSQRWVIVESTFNRAAERLYRRLPHFGEMIAVDSTIVHTHSNPNAGKVSDQEANWAHKRDAQGKTIAIWGYKAHVVSDARYELPIGLIVTPGNVNDITQLIPLMHKIKAQFLWFSPQVVICDAGYDSNANYEFIAARLGAIPIIKMRKESPKWTSPDIADYEGTPHCVAGLPLVFWGYDRKKGLKWRCPEKVGKASCPIWGKCGTSVVWMKLSQDYRRLCQVPRASRRWKVFYSNRQAAERLFSRLKEHRRLDDHCFRGVDKVTAHSLLAALVVAGCALASLKRRKRRELRACVRKVN